MVVDTLGNIIIAMAPFVGPLILLTIFLLRKYESRGKALVRECETWLRERTKI